MAAPSAITELVRRFREQYDVYTSVSYSEAKLRSDFLDSFFVALGWDVHNTQGYAEAYREVIPEDSIKVGAFTKAPDYCFRVGGTRKFFVEAKKPSVNVKDDLAPAFQVRRYAWSAKLPLSILTDFEEFAVYDCRVKPDKNDKASTARIMYLNYTEFETRWDEISSIFSKDAVLKGSFDTYAQAVKGKKGTTEVDAAFLNEIEGWRELFARNIALRNSHLSQRELNFAVQQTIDRIIFLRICEDRGMEAEGKLAATTNGANVYKRLCDLFRLADDKYNSGLFHFSKETGRDLPDQFTLNLEIDDKPLKDIIKGLYYPDCPYEFSVISSDILGQVYEQFLGKVIRLTDGHRAVVEDKPEVKKAGGVYYTPTYIVDYIVKNTVGKLLGDRGRGPGIGDRGTKKGETDDKDISGFGSLAEGDGPGGGNLSTNEAFPESGNVFPHQSDTTSSYINSGKHSRRARKVASSGLSQVSFDSAGLSNGNGNPSADSDEAGLHQSGSTAKGMGFESGRGANAEQVDSSITKSLTPDTRPLTPREASHLRILDPACGSGSFLIGAFQYLLDWHLQSYVESNPQKHATGKNPELYQSHSGDWKLTLAERKRILLDNIYGVDIDPQAVEVTKLSLLLKVLEGESEQSVAGKQKLLHTRVLPDLDRNIKCGNSLIGPDFQTVGAKQALPMKFDNEESLRINAFDWKAEFPAIMKAGGFDAVIGNPPYIRIQALKEWAPVEVEIYKQQYASAKVGNYDIYVVFVEKGLSILNPQGRLGYILPHKFFNSQYGAGLRGLIAKDKNLAQVVHFGDLQIFNGATTYTCLMFLDKTEKDEFDFAKVTDLAAWRDNQIAARGKIFSDKITLSEWNFNVGDGAGLSHKLSQVPLKLGEIANIFVGLQTSADKIYVVPLDANIEEGLTKPFLLTGSLSAYDSLSPSARLLFPYEISDGKANIISDTILQSKFPNGWRYLYMQRDALMKRDGGKMRHKNWYAYVYPKNLIKFDNPKLIVQVTAKKPVVLYDDAGLYMTGGGSGPFYGVRPRADNFPIKYLLGIMNSKLFGWIIKGQSTNLRGGYIKFSKQYIETAPIIMPETSENEKTKTIIDFVDVMLRLKKQLSVSNTAHEKTALQRQIDATDHQIDQLVYELYGLTEEEIKIVENSLG